MLRDEDLRELLKRDMRRAETWNLNRCRPHVGMRASDTWDECGAIRKLVDPLVGHAHAREAVSSAQGICLEGRDGYLIRPAMSAREMMDEANAQHDCLASYIDRYASGRTNIWLMRSTNDPDTPLVTIEVRNGPCGRRSRAATTR